MLRSSCHAGLPTAPALVAAAAALRLGPGLVHVERSPIEFLSVEGVDGRPPCSIWHGHEREPARPSGVTISDHGDVTNFAVGGECVSKGVFVRVKAHVADVNLQVAISNCCGPRRRAPVRSRSKSPRARERRAMGDVVWSRESFGGDSISRGSSDVSGQAHQAHGPNDEVTHVKLPPAEAMASRRRERMMVVVPSLAQARTPKMALFRLSSWLRNGRVPQVWQTELMLQVT